MNILIITSEIGSQGGGLALTCGQLKEILEELNHKIFVESSTMKDLNYSLEGGYDLKLWDKINYSYGIKKLEEKYKNIDLVIAYGAQKNSYVGSIIAKKLNKKLLIVLCGSDVNITFGDLESYKYNYFSLREAWKIVGLSKELIENSKIIYEKKSDIYEVIPNIYNISRNNSYDSVDFQRVNFAMGATYLNEKKGLSNFLRGFGTYCQKYNRREDKLYLFGHVDRDIKEQYEKLIKELKLENQVIFKGYLKREEYLEYLKKIDVYVQSSFFEGCCNSLGEGISQGKFILLSNTGYFAEILRNKFPDIIMESLDVEKIPDLLKNYMSFIEKNDFRRELSLYLKTFLSKEIILKKWEGILKEKEKSNFIESNLAVMFHDVENSYTGLDYHRKGFEKLVDLVHSKGYRFCSYEEYMLSENKTNLIICTFDDGYEGVYRNALNVLKKYNFTATVFICPDLIGVNNNWNRRDIIERYHMTLEMLKELKENNWEIGSHGMGHYNLLRLSQSELEKTFENSKKILEKYFGKVNCFCYPFGEFNSYVKSLVGKYYDFAFSVNSGGNNFERDKYQFTRLVPEELKKIMEKI
ncbi:MAG: polysaccharide deacetylase family protein [Cetobacterium sp.]|uniref:polysaccharide deacetylase family protein n=1 Tax=Cetobacterium sp. TaxID=2071632 RepID=UPI003F2F51F2